MRPFKRFVLATGVCAVFCNPVVSAQYEEKYGVSWQIGTEVKHFENLFLKPVNQANSETLVGTSVGLDYLNRYSLQTFSIKAKITDFRYSSFDYLDFLGKDITGAWQWSVTPDFTGTLSSSRQESLNSFVDYEGNTRNLRKERKDGVDVRWRVTGGWHLAVGGDQSAVANTIGGQRFFEGDYTANNIEYGVMYRFPSQSQVTLVQMSQVGDYRSRRLDYNNQFDSGFSQTNQEFRLDWRLSGKSTLEAKLGYLDREHDNFPVRDYSGAYGSVGYLWHNGGKLKIKFAGQQTLNSFQSSAQQDAIDLISGQDYYNSSYYRSQQVSVSPAWQITDKVFISGLVQQENRDYLDGLITSPQVTLRQDNLRQALLSLNWAPRDLVAFSLHMSRQERMADRASADFSADSIGVSAAVSF